MRTRDRRGGIEGAHRRGRVNAGGALVGMIQKRRLKCLFTALRNDG